MPSHLYLSADGSLTPAQVLDSTAVAEVALAKTVLAGVVPAPEALLEVLPLLAGPDPTGAAEVLDGGEDVEVLALLAGHDPPGAAEILEGGDVIEEQDTGGHQDREKDSSFHQAGRTAQYAADSVTGQAVNIQNSLILHYKSVVKYFYVIILL